jgi:succinyl-CoA synthetase beta subunit
MAFLAKTGFRATQKALRAPAAAAIQKRYLNVHEYQALEIFSKFGVATPKAAVGKTVAELVEKAKEFPGDEIVIKSQVLAGGRGLGYFKENDFKGGVHVIKNAKVEEYATAMLGKTLITKQTGATGKPCNTLLLCEKFSIKNEKYFAILMDRSFGGPVLVGSKVGGTSIEDIAAATPDAIIKKPIDIMDGINEAQATDMAKQMGFEGAQVGFAATNIMNLYKTFIECDCTLLEINPFAELDDGRVIVCDAKVNFDDNAEFRQKDIHNLRDFSQEDMREVEAKKFDLNYIALDGSVACMVNGAGLAMSTMDLLSLEGGSPANFLDVGGGATKEAVKAAFTIIQEDPKVKSIFVNIFGGIMRCDVIAEGIVGAVQELGLKKPLVVRLVGTNVEMGKKILEDSKLPLEFEGDFASAAKRAVAVAV